jgi:hypothetical protein
MFICMADLLATMRRITVGIQQCLHVAAANACMREWRAGLTVLCMLVRAHFLSLCSGSKP